MNKSLNLSRISCYFAIALIIHRFQFALVTTSSAESGNVNFCLGSNHPLKTGLEFIRKDFNLGVTFHNLTDKLGEIPVLEIVRLFLRGLKGLSWKGSQNVKTSEVRDEGPKIAWAFFPSRLKRLAEIELEIYNVLEKFRKDEGRSFPLLDSYMTDIEESSLQILSRMMNSENKLTMSGNDDPYTYIGSHPLLIYKMIRRLAEDFQPVLSHLKRQNKHDIIEAIQSITGSDTEVLPSTDKDLEDALESLVRIQKGTNLKTNELARGLLQNVNTGIGLTALEALELGAFYLDKKTNYDYALEWLHLALEIVSSCPSNTKMFPIIRDFFQKILPYAITQHNENWEGRRALRWDPGVFNETILPNPHGLNLSTYMKMSDFLKMEAATHKIRMNSTWNWATPLNFIQVCSGLNLQTEEEKRNLKCWYSNNGQGHHQYWTINPLKVELLNENPKLVQIYDFIGDKLISMMKEATSGKLARSKVVDHQNYKSNKVSGGRTSVQTWLGEEQPGGRFLQGLTTRLELLTGLHINRAMHVDASNAYQVATYGQSHFYEPHLDAFTDRVSWEAKGNRITTIMGYLSDVEVGGRTGFPVLGTSAEPIKGSIVIWENLGNDMVTRDGRTYHGGCPVVLGVKWITNKWILSNNNMFKRQCKAK